MKPNDRISETASNPQDARRRFIKRSAALGAGFLAPAWSMPGALAQTAASSSSDATQKFAAFLEDFTKADPREGQTDLSAAAFSKAQKANNATLERLRAIDRAALSKEDNLNYRFAESILAGRGLKQGRMLWKMDPRVYLQFSTLARLIENPDASNQDAAKAAALLRAIPTQLKQGRANLKVNVPRFRELALFMADGAFAIFRETVPKFAERHPGLKFSILGANTRAIAALDQFKRFMQDQLPKKPLGNYALGKAAYDRMLKEQYLLAYDSDSLYAYGREQFDATVHELESVAARIDATKTWQQLITEIKNEGPEPAKMIEAHQEWVDKSKAHVLDKKLVPIPWKERVDVVPRAQYLRKTSYYGNFDGAKGPDKDGVWVGHWRINPFEPDWDAETARQYIVEHDWGVIIDTAPHETYAGHHVQGLYQAHNPQKLRRQFGIAIFSEGWGLYNETLMYETGFFPNDRIHLRQLQLRLWRIARVIWDVGLNTGKLSYEQCVSLLADGVGFLRWAAELEVDGSATEPGYRIGYFMGASEIMRMREDVKAMQGPAFTLSDFHERLLKVGNMPPALMREGLMESYKT